MDIYELRKTTSKNKKYKYIYQLIIEGEAVITRRSSKHYSGIWIEETRTGTRYHWFQWSGSATVYAKLSRPEMSAIALTFDELLKYKFLSV